MKLQAVLLQPVFCVAGMFCGFAVVFWRKYDILNISLTAFRLQFNIFCVKLYLWKKRLFPQGVPWLCKVCTASFFAKIAGKNSASNTNSRVITPPSITGKKNPIKICTSRKIWYTIYVSEKDSSFRYVRRIRRRNSFLSTCVPRL